MKNKRRPAEVLEVHKALCQNAVEAGLSFNDAVSCYFADGEWRIDSNREDGSSAMIYRNGAWFYRDPHTGEDKAMRGGKAEALDNCACWFTG